MVSVEIDLGQFVPKARLQTNLTLLMRKLIERIEVNANSSNPAAARMLGDLEPEGYPVEPASHIGDDSRADPTKLNESQHIALESALGRNLTYIWGPPGTGKTHTIGTISKHLYDADRSVLVVSHTNNAVDQAIKFVAETLADDLDSGVVIRIGEISDDSLSTVYPQVQLKTQVALRSKGLVEQRELLQSKQNDLADSLAGIERTIAVIEWVNSSTSQIKKLAEDLQYLREGEQTFQTQSDELVLLENKHPELIILHKSIVLILSTEKNLVEKENALWNLKRQRDQIEEKVQELKNQIASQDKKLTKLKEIQPLRKERSSLPSWQEQQTRVQRHTNEHEGVCVALNDAKDELSKAKAALREVQNAGAIKRVFISLSKEGDLQKVVSDLGHQIPSLETERVIKSSALRKVEKQLSRIVELDRILEENKSLGSISEESHKKEQLFAVMDKHKLEMKLYVEQTSDLFREITDQKEMIRVLSAKVEGDPKEVYRQVCEDLKQIKNLRQTISPLKKELHCSRTDLKTRLISFFRQIKEWIKIDESSTQLEQMLDEINFAHRRLEHSHPYIEKDNYDSEASSLRHSISELDTEIQRIDVSLNEVEGEVIASASIIGATLTKTYLSDEIQNRKFDTVILDEASMAPIPALWVAALLAEANLILVGDFKQLPPIVLSNNELTKNWLGRDIFDKSGIQKLYEDSEHPNHFVPLVEQRRMLPEISSIANIFYNGILRNRPVNTDALTDFQHWYSFDSKKDGPVVLVDTGSLNAWVTSVVRGGKSSRLNFLSATVAVDLAEQLLGNLQYEAEVKSPKILIVSPYRPHTKLINVLIKDNKLLVNNITAGTVHSFQGSEAPVVIFDLVVDEPHFRVNLFMPQIDDQIKRLLNVAITRAKYRLFILGDFDYCLKLGKKAFLGKTLIPMLLKSFPRIEAKDLIPDGLAGRAAMTQMTMLGGQVESDATRLVVNQQDFFRLLSSDLEKAKSRIVIYSPFLTQDRVSFLLPQLQAARDRDVDIYVITKSHSERNKSELQTIMMIEHQLSKIEIIVMHKLRMHEKLVFIDESVLWSGSLNPLSFSNTQEVMERRISKSVVDDYLKVLRVEELISVADSDESVCPICGENTIAAEGADQPFYWRCVNDECYSRSIDQAYPYNGILACSRCDGPVEFGYWGEKASWRCTMNKRHHQRLYKSHLRLPKMAALVPIGERRKLLDLLGIEKFDFSPGFSNTKSSGSQEQGDLFND